MFRNAVIYDEALPRRNGIPGGIRRIVPFPLAAQHFVVPLKPCDRQLLPRVCSCAQQLQQICLVRARTNGAQQLPHWLKVSRFQIFIAGAFHPERTPETLGQIRPDGLQLGRKALLPEFFDLVGPLLKIARGVLQECRVGNIFVAAAVHRGLFQTQLKSGRHEDLVDDLFAIHLA